MLEQEFFKMTGINLTGEEYAKVEALYNTVKMELEENIDLEQEERKYLTKLLDAEVV